MTNAPTFAARLRGFFAALVRGVVWLASFAALITAAVFLGQGLLSLRATAAEDLADPLPIEVVTVTEQQTYEARRRFTGRVEAAQVADLSFAVPGEVAQVLVDIGDLVTRGQPVARLDQTRLRARVDELRAAIDETAASLSRAEAALARIEPLARDGFATDQDLDDAIAERDGLRARQRQLQRSLLVAEEDLDDSVLTAPFGGTIVQRYLDAGVQSTAGQPVLRLNEQGVLQARIGVPQPFAERLRLDQSYDLISDAKEGTGTLVAIGDDVDPTTRTVSLLFDIDEDPGFAPGGLIRLSLTESRQGPGIWVPALAITESFRGLWSVYVVVEDQDGDYRIGRKDIEIIHIDDDRVFVRGTLQSGDQVVTAAPFRLVPGQAVTPVTAASGTSILSQSMAAPQ